MLIDILTQVFGIAAAAVGIISYQLRRPRALFFALLLSSTLFVVHYIMLGGWTGAALNAIGAVRMLLLMVDKKWARSPWILAALLAGIVGVGVLTWAGWISLLPTVAMAVATCAIWTRDARVLRLAQLTVVSPLWLTYGIITFSLGSILTDSFSIVSILVSFLRFGWHGMTNDTGKPQ